MVEVQAVGANKEPAAGATEAVEQLKDKLVEKKLPQDFLFSPPADQLEIATPRETSTNGGSPAGNDFAANAHAWVSPNKSDEVPSSKESSPEAPSELTTPREAEISNDGAKEAIEAASAKVDLGAEYEADFAPVAAETKPDLNLSVEGRGLDIEGAEVPSVIVEDEEVTLDASGKDFIKIIHNGKATTLLLPSEVASTLELSEALATAFGVEEEIIGLKTTALLVDDDSSTFQQHGDVVIPLSALSQLRRLVKDAEGLEGLPSFNLVTTNFDMYLSNKSLVESEDASSRGDESLSVSSEGAAYTEAFMALVQDPEFNPFEANVLLRFGIDHAEQGNVLFRAAHRVGVYMGDTKYFVSGLKAIANVLLVDEASPSMDACDDTVAAGTDARQQTGLTLFGMTDFVVAADELFESDDLSAQQYCTLLNAIFAGHSSVLSLFDLYHNADFVAGLCNDDGDFDEGLRGSLVLRDLHHLARKLEPVQPQSQDDELLKWAIKTGIHNFGTGLEPAGLPQEFVNIIFHMFSSGDEMILAACQKMVESDDSTAVEDVLLREYSIYERNAAFREEEEPKSGSLLEPSSAVKASDDCLQTAPDCLLTAVACLADSGELSEDAAAGLLASYSKGNALLRDVYDHFIEFGGTDDFLDMLKLVASTAAPTVIEKPDISSEDDVFEEANDSNAFQAVVESMWKEGLFGPVDIAALRLAVARKEATLTQALADYREGCMDARFFKETLLAVVDSVVAETENALGV